MKLLHLAAICALAAVPGYAGPMNDAAKKGDLAEIERLLAAGADVNEADPMASPIHYAAMRGHADAVALLAAQGADVNAGSKIGAPLHAAARFGHAEAVLALLAAGARPDVRDERDLTPLMHAAWERKPEAADALIAGGADVGATGVMRNAAGFGAGPTTALHLAITRKSDAVETLLRSAGAGPMPPEVPADLATRGDPARGDELAHTFCTECHEVSADDPPNIGHRASGPPLIGVIGRPVADLPGFAYSDALRAHGGDWTPERVYAFALTPMLTVPGTRMDWAPDRTPQMIADIVAYLVMQAE